MELLQKKLQGIKFDFTKELECAICLELLTDPVLTKCNHQFCRGCLRNAIEKRCIKRCPICNEVLSKRSMIESATLKPLIRDLKLLLEAIESDFELQQDMKVASELSTANAMPVQPVVPASKSADVQLDKNPRQPKAAPSFLTQISEEHKHKCDGNTVKSVLNVQAARKEATTESIESTQSTVNNDFEAKSKENDTNIGNLEAKVDDQSHNFEIVMTRCGDDGNNTSSQSTIELVLEKKPPLEAVPRASICATSKVAKWLMNRCMQDPDSPISLSSDISKQASTSSSKETSSKASKIAGRIFKSRVVLNRNECVANRTKVDREASQDPYSFISSQKVYPKKGRKRKTRQDKRKSENSPKKAGGKFANLINLRERKLRTAKEKSTEKQEKLVDQQNLQSQPFPSSCLVNVHDKFDEFVLNGINKQPVGKQAKRLEKTELWNDDEECRNVFVTPVYASKSPNREKENLVKKQVQKRKSRSRDRKIPKRKEDDNTLNLLRSEIMDAEQHELCIEAPKRKLSSKLCAKTNMKDIAQNTDLPFPCDNKIRKLNSASNGKDSTAIDVENCEDIVQVASAENITENKLKPLNAKNSKKKQVSNVHVATALISPIPKQQVTPPRIDGQSKEKSANSTSKDAPMISPIPKQQAAPQLIDGQCEEKVTNSTSKDASVQFARIPDGKSEPPLNANVQMPEEDIDHSPIVVDDFPALPRSHVQELAKVRKSTDQQISKDNVEPAAKTQICKQISEGYIDSPVANLQDSLKSTKLSKRKVEPCPEAVDNFIMNRNNAQESLNAQNSTESKQMPEVNLELAKHLINELRMHETAASEITAGIQAAPLQKLTPTTLVQAPPLQKLTPTTLVQAAPLQKLTPTTLVQAAPLQKKLTPTTLVQAAPLQKKLTPTTLVQAAPLQKKLTPTTLDLREFHKEHSKDMPLLKNTPVSKGLAENVPEVFLAEQMDMTSVSHVSNRKLIWQYFGTKHGKPLFSFVKLGNLHRTLAGLHNSVSCQTEPSDQILASKNESETSNIPDISSKHLNKNSAAVNVYRSVACQTVPEETVPVKCQHCLFTVPKAECDPFSATNVTNDWKTTMSAIKTSKAKIPESQGDAEMFIPPSQDTPYFDAELIGLFKMESPKKLPEIQTKPMRFESQKHSEIQATASFDVMSVITTETDTGPAFDILAPETCTQHFDNILRRMTEDEIVPESETDICVPEINKIQNVSTMPNSETAEFFVDNGDCIASSQMFTDDDVIPPTPPAENASGAWRRSPLVSPSGVIALSSQKRKLTPMTPSISNKKTKIDVKHETKSKELIEIEEVDLSSEPKGYNQSPRKLDLIDSESCHDEPMTKVLANINLDLAKSTIIEDDIDGIFTPEVTLLEAANPMITVDNVRATPGLSLIKGPLDNDMSEEMFSVDQEEFAKPYPSSQKNSKDIVNGAKVLLDKNCKGQASICSKSSKLPESAQLELTGKDTLSTDEEFVLDNGLEFKSMDWKDFGTDEDSCEAFPRNKETNSTTASGPLYLEQSTVSTLQTLPTTQQREILKSDIEKDKQKLKEIEMLLAKKQHCTFKPCVKKEDGSAAIKISTYEFDSDDPLEEELLIIDDESFHVQEKKIENPATELTTRGIYSWDTDLGSWESQDNGLKILASQKKQSQSLQKCMPKVDTSPTVATTPKVPASNYSLVVSGSGASEQRTVQLLATQLKGNFHSKFNDSTTHVIVKLVGNLCERTLKYILGISAGRWIVSYKWVTDSLQAGKAMPEADYEVVGDTNGGLQNGPHKARTNLGKPLLTDYEICLMKPFTELTEDQLRLILNYCGATCVSGPEGFSGKVNTKQIVVCESQFHKSNEFDDLVHKNQVVVVTRDWLLDSIASYTIKPTKSYTLR